MVNNYTFATKSSLDFHLLCVLYTFFYTTPGNHLSRSSAVMCGFVTRLGVTKVKATNKEMALMMCGLMACSGTALEKVSQEYAEFPLTIAIKVAKHPTRILTDFLNRTDAALATLTFKPGPVC